MDKRMDKNLLEYVKNIVELEKRIFEQTQMIDQLDEEMEYLGCPATFFVPEPPKLEGWVNEFMEGIGSFFGIGALLGFVISIFSGNTLTNIIGCGIASVILFAIIAILSTVSANDKAKDAYETQLIQYEIMKKKDELRVNKENQEKARLMEMRDILDTKREETTAVRDAYYSKNVIYGSYRDLFAMCSIYDYFLSGKCFTLEGHEGAYNKFDDDKKWHKMYEMFNDFREEFLDSIDQIKNNQVVLYNAINDGNKIAQHLVEESIRQSKLLECTVENSEVAAYYAACSAEEARQTKWLTYYDIQKRERES